MAQLLLSEQPTVVNVHYRSDETAAPHGFRPVEFDAVVAIGR